MTSKLILGDCYNVLLNEKKKKFQIAYLDPPFFTQRNHKLKDRDGNNEFKFEDLWKNQNEYFKFIFDRIKLVKETLKDDGLIFVHCDHNSNYIIRFALNEIFGIKNFQSEIIWYYKRWSNSKKGLLQSYQNILMYSKSNSFKFYKTFNEYSKTTNIDQILQKRSRDDRNKSIYKKNIYGKIVNSKEKEGVPLSDVWEIPFLNPKARERIGYPTQKPILLLERIISISTDENDFILDPFCGSGSMLVAAKLNNRNFLGIDKSKVAIELCNKRLKIPFKSISQLMEKGLDAYSKEDERLKSILFDIPYLAVQRNKGINAILKKKIKNKFVFIKLQNPNEKISEAYELLKKATLKKEPCVKILVQFYYNANDKIYKKNNDTLVINSTNLTLKELLDKNL
jgi:site-specific DNA-methyltransferase (adenine-specific)